MSTSSTSLEEKENGHGLALHIRVARARACALMLILSDALAIMAILAAGGYLSALNTENQFAAAGDHGTAFVPSLLVAIVLVLSGAAYYWWERNVRQNGGAGQQLYVILACALMFVALVAQTVIAVTLGYANPPFDAYESLILLLTWYTAVHLLLSTIVGLLMVGRAMRGRIAGHEYLAEASGYWWYYTVVASLIMWLFSAVIH